MKHQGPVEAVASAPDGTTIATAAGNSPVATFWDVATHEVCRRLRDPSGVIRAPGVRPDGAALATGGDGKVVTIWDLATGRSRAVLKGHLGPIRCLAFRATAALWRPGATMLSVTIWDVASGAERDDPCAAHKRRYLRRVCA